MDDLDLRKWAVSEAISPHSKHGMDTKSILIEAAQLIAFVQPPVEKKKDAA